MNDAENSHHFEPFQSDVFDILVLKENSFLKKEKFEKNFSTVKHLNLNVKFVDLIL